MKLVPPARDVVRIGHPLSVQLDGSAVRIEHDDPPKIVSLAMPFKVKQPATVGLDDQRCLVGERDRVACGHFKASYDMKLVATVVSRPFVELQTSQVDLWARDDRGGLWCAGHGMCARFRKTGKFADATWHYEYLEHVDDAPPARTPTA